MKFVVVCTLLLFGAVACGGDSAPPGPPTGRVLARDYDDEDEWTQQVCYSNGKLSWCVPIYHHDDPHWYVQLRNMDAKVKVGWREVDEATYARCVEGSWCDTST